MVHDPFELFTGNWFVTTPLDQASQGLLKRLRENGTPVVLQAQHATAPRKAKWMAVLGALVLTTAWTGQAGSESPVGWQNTSQEVAAVKAVMDLRTEKSDQAWDVLIETASTWRDAHLFEELLRDAVHQNQPNRAAAVLETWKTSKTTGLNQGLLASPQSSDWKIQAWQQLAGSEGQSFDAWEGPGFELGNLDVASASAPVEMWSMEEVALPEGWVAQKISEGWAASDLAMKWRETMAIGDGLHERWGQDHEGIDWPEWVGAKAVRVQSQDALNRVNTVQDWNRYQESWGVRMQVLPGIERQAGWPLLNAVAWDPQWERRRQGQGQQSEASPEMAAWQAYAWSQPLWSFDKIQQHNPFPVAPDMATAEKWLDDAIKESGLASVRWPVQTPHTPEAWSWLAHELRRVNQELRTTTGWSGPVLGLSGRVHLDIVSAIEDGSDGQMFKLDHPTDPSRSVALITVAAHPQGLGPVAHEWLHALEVLVGGYRVMPDETPDGSAWEATNPFLVEHQGRLREELFGAAVDPGVERRAQTQAFVARWRAWDAQVDTADLLTVAGGWAHPQHPAGEQMQTWLTEQLNEGASLPFAGDALALLRAAQAHESTAVLASRSTGARIVGHDQAWWVAMSAQEDQDQKPYWSLPVEMTARAFEAQWQPGMAGASEADSRSGYDDRPSTDLLRPTGAEAMVQQAAWVDFFQALSPWWERQQGVAPLIERLRERQTVRASQDKTDAPSLGRRGLAH